MDTAYGRKTPNSAVIAESGLLVAVGTILSLIKIYELPMGGSVTLLSMLPLVLLGYRRGVKWGIIAGCAYALLQIVTGLGAVRGLTGATLALSLLFDYFVAFGVLGIAGIFRKMKHGFIIGTAVVIFLRFVCHYITGVTIWRVFAGEQSPYIYSLLYNGSYMGIEFATHIMAAFVISKNRGLSKYI